MSTSNLILSVNAGSSSLKVTLYSRAQNPSTEPVTEVLAASISSISSPPAQFSLHSSTKEFEAVSEELDSVHDHAAAFEHFLVQMERRTKTRKEQITHVCHRVVHGGDYADPVHISGKTYHHIQVLSDLAPLHNGAALSVIEGCISSSLPNAISIAFFDTTFHRSIPEHISAYPIDQTIARKRGLKKYGFHGLSYSYILNAVSTHFRKSPEQLNLIVLHLGSGASAACIKNGASLDTSMGLTPLTGLPGATRSGAIDPSLVFHYTNDAGRISHDIGNTRNLHVTEAEEILNKNSGWNALAGTSNFGEIVDKAFKVPPDAASRLAFDLFTDRILDFIGSYYLKLGGQVDALVFSGGIGEMSTQLRDTVGEKIRCLGFAGVDAKKNADVANIQGAVIDISSKGDVDHPSLLVCRTDEQFEMAKQCVLNADL